eukprot:9466721-Pyramimonas_sp.AAC.1
MLLIFLQPPSFCPDSKQFLRQWSKQVRSRVSPLTTWSLPSLPVAYLLMDAWKCFFTVANPPGAESRVTIKGFPGPSQRAYKSGRRLDTNVEKDSMANVSDAALSEKQRTRQSSANDVRNLFNFALLFWFPGA